MKKIIYIIVLFFAAGLSSCKKFLTKVPTDFVSPENYFNTEAELNTALTGVYDMLGSAGLYGELLWAQFEIATDESYYKQSGTTTGTHVLVYDASNPSVLSVWKALYSGIERANMVLANINKPTMSEANRSVAKGEALFLRAYYYFLLASNFGDVPLKLEPTTSLTNMELPRTPIKEVYAKILADMTEAEGLVKPITAYNHPGRISKTAVQGILARVCLKMAGEPLKDVSKYADARTWAKKVIDGGLHRLNPDYVQIFVNEIQDLYDWKECIWEVEFKGNLLTAGENETGRLGILNGILAQNDDIGYSYSQWNTHLALFNLYTDQDLRRDWNHAPYSYSGTTNNKVFTGWGYARNVSKWRRELELLKPKNKNYNGVNFPILRYADVLLMFAEADNEINGPNAENIAAINDVKRRGVGKVLNGANIYTVNITNGGTGYTTAPTVTLNGGGFTRQATATATVTSGRVTAITIADPGSFYATAPTVTFTGGGGTGAVATTTLSTPTDADLKPAQTATKDVLRLALIDERSKELCYEGLRRGDLTRWGIFVQRMRAAASQAANYNTLFSYAQRAGNNISEKHNLLPIPLSEIALNRKLTQNPGWE